MLFYKLIAAGSLALSATVAAHAEQCPVASDVVAALPKTEQSISVTKMGQELGETVRAGASLHPLANRIKQELPGAQDALVVDLMLAAYCQFLETTAQSPSQQTALFQRFESLANDAVFKAPSDETKPGSWLFD